MSRKLSSQGFGVDIAKIVEKTKARMDDALQSIVYKLDAECVKGSPVGNPSNWKVKRAPKGYVGGRFRGNWQIGINDEPLGTLNAVDPRGNIALARAAQAVTPGKAGDVFWIKNNLPYARRLEYDAHSGQAPSGIVGPALLTFRKIFSESIQEAKKK